MRTYERIFVDIKKSLFFSYIVDDYGNTCFEVYEYENETLSSIIDSRFVKKLNLYNTKMQAITKNCQSLKETEVC